MKKAVVYIIVFALIVSVLIPSVMIFFPEDTLQSPQEVITLSPSGEIVVEGSSGETLLEAPTSSGEIDSHVSDI